jgi:hypothetical protein
MRRTTIQTGRLRMASTLRGTVLIMTRSAREYLLRLGNRIQRRNLRSGSPERSTGNLMIKLPKN